MTNDEPTVAAEDLLRGIRLAPLTDAPHADQVLDAVVMMKVMDETGAIAWQITQTPSLGYVEGLGAITFADMIWRHGLLNTLDGDDT